jgi:hypothetical protein
LQYFVSKRKQSRTAQGFPAPPDFTASHRYRWRHADEPRHPRSTTAKSGMNCPKKSLSAALENPRSARQVKIKINGSTTQRPQGL